MIPAALIPALAGIFPMTLVTVSEDRVPNITNLSRVWTVDSGHIAVANQLLKKSMINLEKVPLALLRAVDPADMLSWEVDIRYVRSETDGPLYDRIAQELQDIAWMAGDPQLIELRSVVVFQVEAVRKGQSEPEHPVQQADGRFGDMLQALSEVLDWHNTAFWVPADEEDGRIVTARGTLGSGASTLDEAPIRRLAALVRSRGTVVRLRNIRSQLRFLHTVRMETEKLGCETARQESNGRENELKTSFLGFPLHALDRFVGVVCCEASNAEAELFDQFEDEFIRQLGRKLGETAAQAEALPEEQRRPLFAQVVKRALLEWAKAKEPHLTVLSAREQQVAVCVAQGMTNAEIAQALFISKRTVTTHLERIFQKLELSSRAALTRYVLEADLPADSV
ncbi:LuxR C-terminal-related transcriptional regulator [Paenibacillus sp. HJGM_3]|uniref:LuxR C-terminal-related transcriptional regulator n=1 Tax=Paenibacillus sp. HJGM_3 TaxID=3379816 RepID=UPI0038587F64